MNKFKPEYIALMPGDLADADVDFFEYEIKLPVIYVYDSRLGAIGAIALDGDFRSFPPEEIYSYNASQLTKDAFMRKYPNLSTYFQAQAQQAA